jgi:hypothetical protein
MKLITIAYSLYSQDRLYSELYEALAATYIALTPI